MARISQARKTLQHALIATSDPDERIRLAHELNTLISHEERINGRARRKRANAIAKTPAPLPDPNEEIDLVFPADAVVPPQPTFGDMLKEAARLEEERLRKAATRNATSIRHRLPRTAGLAPAPLSVQSTTPAP